ncbi:CocE/NonD family hydrolase [Sinosporangium siamense]|uniref:ABC transporter ATP-binding protein n=1 Tax=Sinosporangium siamense TaxID=1367973 RepID=A0A919REE8_9ACTN|nr:CocE/NonD family hydrolase [Sinosporangium siamense]GII91887.1 ABC transporter ATP-binding protein [Sinosporangium siamense]
MRRLDKATVWIAAAAVAIAAVGIWLVWQSAPEVRGETHTISVVDGPDDDLRVALDATFYPPSPAPTGGRAPAVLLGHGFGGSKDSVRDEAVLLAQAGYAVLTWSARGFGRSEGEIALNSPDYEIKDTRQLIDWLAQRPEVALDKPGDPRVGMTGGSYGGAVSLMTAAYDARVDAIAPQITWFDLADALFPNGGGSGPESGVFKRMWAGLFFSRGGPATARPTTAPGAPAANTPPRPLTAEEARCGRFLPEICEMYELAAETGAASEKTIETLRRASPVSVQGRIKVPTLLLQGKRDSLFPLSHADANAKAIAATGAPVRVSWFDGGHDGGDGELDWLHEQVAGWFDHYLKKTPGSSPGSKFTVTRDGGRDPGTRRPVLVHADAPIYPGLAGTEVTDLPLTGGEQNVATPPGGAPASISSVPGLAAMAGGGAAGANLTNEMAGQSASFESAPLPAPLHVTGAPTVRVRVSGEGTVTLFAKLYDVGGPGTPPVLPAGQVSPIRLTIPKGAPQAEATVTLPAVDHLFQTGRRLRVTFTTTDLGYANATSPSVHGVALITPKVTVPKVAALSTPATGLPWWVWALPLAALLAAAVMLATGRLRRSAEPRDTALADVPLQITGLGKSYRNGDPAVSDLGFRVERGQVLGLLGPNGAGKTTTMRMLMGLIQPDSGEIRIFGHRVTPGAPVLSRLGSFVEGPGFLPHLSGRANLELYWRATGRPAGDAHVDEALAIAGLGAALDRAVRTYSQGMRQRLAIAQAMLGLPDLLVLDEPANGLDPPQIREMREVLKGYARRGRTVIVSSHLLAEVEQTCTHLVVMHRGRLVIAGPVEDLLGSHTETAQRGRLEDVFLELIGENA